MINYQTTGNKRKQLVNALSQITNCPATYLGVPSCAYAVGEYTISRLGEVEPTPSDEIRLALEGKGFTGTEQNNGTIIEIPRADLTDLALTNFQNMVTSKRAILRRSLKLNNTLPYDITPDALIIRWFENTPPTDSAKKLVKAMIRHAKYSKRISPEPIPPENPRYSMRAFLYALGFSGSEFHDLRMEFIGHLPGDVSFRRGHRKKKEPSVGEIRERMEEIYP